MLAVDPFFRKQPMLSRTICPPQYETPFSVFDESAFTPNDAFFVRWQLAEIPGAIDSAAHRIAVTGAVQQPLLLSLDDLQNMPAVDVVAVNQCAGNSRASFSPTVSGTPWSNGAMGNARWTGVRLRDIIQRAKPTATAVQVQFSGAERATGQTPQFRKSLDVDVALQSDAIVAYLMNSEPLPLLNGYPVRLVVPGWYATYWVKMLSEITILDHVDDNHWMAEMYRVPDTPDYGIAPGTTALRTIPVGRMRVRSFVTNVCDGARIAAGMLRLRGIAFDGGSGIRSVDLSRDGGNSWQNTVLEHDDGPYAFRRWHASCEIARGTHVLAVRASANDGAVQPAHAAWNPGGYAYNAIEKYRITAT